MVFEGWIQLCCENFCLDVKFYPDVFRELHEAFASWVVIILVFLNHKSKSEIKHFTLFNRNLGSFIWH